ncbi:hypothetical protein K443DRAFT_402442 [Laccaria amethystina LaAM-08-1]|uniref:Unplaced genomic scaffold K443scaffold_314, whole genome shotgun sequence n=1 Tax=Laccaria amethystina LaAM-08-1 TaxID=1095629 RepID=A0A0C9WQD5_9AGAR|nr:hypothetical protein K443DRAFT_402442 [Laccaria amethystina LaAM-08-1]
MHQTRLSGTKPPRECHGLASRVAGAGWPFVSRVRIQHNLFNVILNQNRDEGL